MKRYLITAFVLSSFLTIYSQSTRNLVNEGVDLYNNKEYTDSEVNFLKGLDADPDNFEAQFNLGDAYYKQEKYEDAIKAFNSALGKAEDNEMKSKIHHNIGNSLLKSQKIKESIEAYKTALKYNPDDNDTKYNLSYALSLQNQQQKQDQQNDQNKDKNEDKQDQQNKQDQRNNDDQNKDKQKQDEQQQPQSGEDQQTEQDNLKQAQKNEISKEEAERILDALRNNEKDLQKKLRKKAGTTVKTEKDW